MLEDEKALFRAARHKAPTRESEARFDLPRVSGAQSTRDNTFGQQNRPRFEALLQDFTNNLM
ncbi:unnamed protein product [Arabis nemorensis]|uniref:Uncharacterized protein n=1 Tax=Arabis nemorensis TaxID=586526 RepID=A0A565BYE7_9BRAS|nr:unnamed protein product [Arabis nemorensis]